MKSILFHTFSFALVLDSHLSPFSTKDDPQEPECPAYVSDAEIPCAEDSSDDESVPPELLKDICEYKIFQIFGLASSNLSTEFLRFP